jgi:hypothetical protein
LNLAGTADMGCVTKYRSSVAFDEPKIKYDLAAKYELSSVIEIEIFEIVAIAKPSINRT